jgi:hypothetical protein
MNTVEDIKRLQDMVDSMSEFSEGIAIKIREFFKNVVWFFKKICILMFFGVVIGLFGNFIRTLFLGKEDI